MKKSGTGITILLINDNIENSAPTEQLFRENGFTTFKAKDLGDSKYYVENWLIDTVVIESSSQNNFPEQVMKALQFNQVNCPVLVTTPSITAENIVSIFDSGADDYLEKPYHPNEMLARTHAILRRWHKKPSCTIDVGALEIDHRNRKVTVDGEQIYLTNQEYSALLALSLREGEIISRFDLIDRISTNCETHNTNILDVIICSLRKKIGLGIIKTVRGIGYRISCP